MEPNIIKVLGNAFFDNNSQVYYPSFSTIYSDFQTTMTHKYFKSENVIDLYCQLDQLKILIWLDGGWGVDALLGCEMRPHCDLDIIVQQSDVSKLREFLALHGYTEVTRDDTF